MVDFAAPVSDDHSIAGGRSRCRCGGSDTKTIIQERDVYGPGEHRWNPTLLNLAERYGFTPKVCGPMGPGGCDQRCCNCRDCRPSRRLNNTTSSSPVARRKVSSWNWPVLWPIEQSWPASPPSSSPPPMSLQLVAAHHQGRLAQYFSRAVQCSKLLVIDEIGYLPLGRDEANLCFNVIAKRYEHGSVVLTSNLPFSQ